MYCYVPGVVENIRAPDVYVCATCDGFASRKRCFLRNENLTILQVVLQVGHGFIVPMWIRAIYAN